MHTQGVALLTDLLFRALLTSFVTASVNSCRLIQHPATLATSFSVFLAPQSISAFSGAKYISTPICTPWHAMYVTATRSVSTCWCMIGNNCSSRQSMMLLPLLNPLETATPYDLSISQNLRAIASASDAVFVRGGMCLYAWIPMQQAQTSSVRCRVIGWCEEAMSCHVAVSASRNH